MSLRVPSSPRPFLPLIALAVVGAPAAAQGFLERSDTLGLQHTFRSGLDRIADLVKMHDWVQQGIGVADLDGDGDPDVVAISRLGSNSVFRNDGGSFADISAFSKVRSSEFDTCCALSDVDRDGDVDLYIGGYDPGIVAEGRGRMLRNDGGAAFDDVSVISGTRGGGHTVFANFFDVDLDGWADLHLSEFTATENILYRNNADGSFTDVTAAVGADQAGSTHVSAIGDFDGDGLVDIYAGNDWTVTSSAGLPNEIEVLLHGRSDFTCGDDTVGSGADEQATTMGFAIGDVNYDGLPDMYKSQMGPQWLLVNHGWPSGGAWTHEEVAYGVDLPQIPDILNPGQFGVTVGWGTAFLDVDFDPWLDLFLVTGHVSPVGTRFQQNYLMRGNGPGAGFTFSDFTIPYGLFDTTDSRGLSVSDLDRDGDVDLLIAPPGGALQYWENRIDPAGQGWLAVEPLARTSGPDGDGVIVRWTDSLGYPHTRWIGADAPTASDHEGRALFGLGTETSVDLSVEFPSGIVLDLPGTLPNQTVVAEEPLLAPRSTNRIELAPVAATGGAPVTGPGVAVGASAPTAGSAALRRRGLVAWAFAHDASGVELDGTATVTIEAPGLVALGPVKHVSGHVFAREFASPTAVGDHRFRFTYNGFTVRTQPRLSVVGAVDAAATTVMLRPEAVRAASSDTLDIEVAPKDAAGRLLGPGRTVEFQIAGTPSPQPMSDRGDGSYVATVSAPLTPGVRTVDFLVDGVVLAAAASVEAGGFPDATASELYFESPEPDPAQNVHQYQLMVRPRDASGLRLGRAADVQIVILPAPASEPVTLVPTGSTAQDDGDHWYVLERDPASALDSAQGVYEVWVDGVLIATQGYLF